MLLLHTRTAYEYGAYGPEYEYGVLCDQVTGHAVQPRTLFKLGRFAK